MTGKRATKPGFERTEKGTEDNRHQLLLSLRLQTLYKRFEFLVEESSPPTFVSGRCIYIASASTRTFPTSAAGA